MTTHMTNAEYVDWEGIKCPACRSTRIYGDEYSMEGSTVSLNIECANCGAAYDELYQLIGYTNLVVAAEAP